MDKYFHGKMTFDMANAIFLWPSAYIFTKKDEKIGKQYTQF